MLKAAGRQRRGSNLRDLANSAPGERWLRKFACADA